MSIAYAANRVTLHEGDCRDVLTDLPIASVDAVVTDPPYELTDGSGRQDARGFRYALLKQPTHPVGHGFMGLQWDASGVAHSAEFWREALRVLKPGGHLLAFGGTRTYHRMAVAIEDAGFEIRDSIHWVYGSGFPKSHDVSKAIDKAVGAEREVVAELPASYVGSMKRDAQSVHGKRPDGDPWGNEGKPIQVTSPATDEAKQWDGWGTALKPSHEPIVVARKPLIGTVAANVLEYGTGAINVDGCRVGDGTGNPKPAYVPNYGNDVFGKGLGGGAWENTSGRWPTNLVLGDEAAEEMDRQRGTTKSGSRKAGEYGLMGYMGAGSTSMPEVNGDSGGASRFFPVFKYQAKADADDRVSVDGVAHATVKPLDLMRWLVRLVTPSGGTVLDPFAGTGTTLEAARVEGFRAIGIERDEGYMRLAVARLQRRFDPVAYHQTTTRDDQDAPTLFDEGDAA